MRIHKLVLHNIRSYQHQEIEFPGGTILLAGDIGSGKSTILLALDFALFGIQAGTLPGGSLLRNGTSQGFVEIIFDLDSLLVTLRRNLKKESSSIVQEAGFIMIDGNKQHLSPVELKDKVLSLLHYPRELVTKTKNLIYRYTVYTPQEEMKQILFGDKDHRLEILRRVFSVDKYKRIRDNSQIYLGHIKIIRRELAVKVSDLEEKIDLRSNIEISLKDYGTKLFDISSQLTEARALLDDKDQEIIVLEKRLHNLYDLQKKFELTSLELKNKTTLKEKNALDIETTSKNIKIIEKEISDSVVIDHAEVLKKEKYLRDLELIISEKTMRIGSLKNRIANSEQIKDSIISLDVCPVCKQKVTPEYIGTVTTAENKNILETKQLLDSLKNDVEKSLREADVHRKNIDLAKRNLSLMETSRFKKKMVDEKREFIERLIRENSQLDTECNIFVNQKKELDDKIEELAMVKEKHDFFIAEQKRLREDTHKHELEIMRIQTEMNLLEKRLNDLSKEIDMKEKAKKELLYWSKMQDWLADHFVPLMAVIEKKILLKIYYDFDSLFQKWFKMLMDTDFIIVKLDEEFTPVIEQNGHIIDYDYLSGGEKTAAALAYRLALNQIITELLGTFKTKDLLILDEPTDGFSETQLDRLRDVFRELKIGQLILVSHESKVESFVDHVIRVNKRDHISEIYR